MPCCVGWNERRGATGDRDSAVTSDSGPSKGDEGVPAGSGCARVGAARGKFLRTGTAEAEEGGDPARDSKVPLGAGSRRDTVEAASWPRVARFSVGSDMRTAPAAPGAEEEPVDNIEAVRMGAPCGVVWILGSVTLSTGSYICNKGNVNGLSRGGVDGVPGGVISVTVNTILGGSTAVGSKDATVRFRARGTG